MREKNIIIWITLLILVAVFCCCVFLMINKNVKDIRTDIDSINSDIIRLDEQLHHQEISTKSDIEQIYAQIMNLNDSICLSDLDLISEAINKTREEIDALNKAEKNNLDRIKALEKELILHVSGAYDNYNFYYYEGDYDSYSVRFSKEYFYKTYTKIPAGEDYEQIPGELKIFLDKSNNEYISLSRWHSRGVSTTMKDIPIKKLQTIEGEQVEFVEYEINNVVKMDIGFTDQYLKVYVCFNAENSDKYESVVIDIVKSIIFY